MKFSQMVALAHDPCQIPKSQDEPCSRLWAKYISPRIPYCKLQTKGRLSVCLQKSKWVGKAGSWEKSKTWESSPTLFHVRDRKGTFMKYLYSLCKVHFLLKKAENPRVVLNLDNRQQACKQFQFDYKEGNIYSDKTKAPEEPSLISNGLPPSLRWAYRKASIFTLTIFHLRWLFY